MTTSGMPAMSFSARWVHDDGYDETSWRLPERSSTIASKTWLTPSVAMNELTFSRTTMKPDTLPSSMHAATLMSAPATGGSDVWSWIQMPIATDADISAPTARSYAPAANGMRNASATRQVTAPSLKISRIVTDER